MAGIKTPILSAFIYNKNEVLCNYMTDFSDNNEINQSRVYFAQTSGMNDFCSNLPLTRNKVCLPAPGLCLEHNYMRVQKSAISVILQHENQ